MIIYYGNATFRRRHVRCSPALASRPAEIVAQPTLIPPATTKAMQYFEISADVSVVWRLNTYMEDSKTNLTAF